MASSTTDRRLGLVGDKGMKAPVACATTANITLSGEQTIDGVLTSSSRVLVKDQTSALQNGIYVSNTSTWTRDLDANGNLDLVTGTMVCVTGGTTQSRSFWQITTTGTITVDTTSITWAIALTTQAVSTFMATVLDDLTAAAARTTLGALGSADNIATATTATNLAGGSAGTIPYQSAAGTTAMLAAGTAGQSLLATGASPPIMGIPVLRGYIDGLALSTAGSSATMSVAAGVASDNTNVFMMSGAAIAKTTSAWAVGTAAGGLDTGAIANSTWYYFFLIRRPDTGVVDVLFSLSSSVPTLPANYTQLRYIGAGLTNGSAQWTKFTQRDDDFWWDTPVADFNAAGSATAALLTCSLPRGRKVKGYFNANVSNTISNGIYISDPDNSDLAPTASAAPGITAGGTVGAGSFIGSQAFCFTNTSAQIRHREVSTNGIMIVTLGWTDSRGRNA